MLVSFSTNGNIHWPKKTVNKKCFNNRMARRNRRIWFCSSFHKQKWKIRIKKWINQKVKYKIEMRNTKACHFEMNERKILQRTGDCMTSLFQLYVSSNSDLVSIAIITTTLFFPFSVILHSMIVILYHWYIRSFIYRAQDLFYFSKFFSCTSSLCKRYATRKLINEWTL